MKKYVNNNFTDLLKSFFYKKITSYDIIYFNNFYNIFYNYFFVLYFNKSKKNNKF